MIETVHSVPLEISVIETLLFSLSGIICDGDTLIFSPSGIMFDWDILLFSPSGNVIETSFSPSGTICVCHTNLHSIWHYYYCSVHLALCYWDTTVQSMWLRHFDLNYSIWHYVITMLYCPSCTTIILYVIETLVSQIILFSWFLFHLWSRWWLGHWACC